MTTAGTGDPNTPYNYSPPSNSSTEGYVADTSYIWVDDFAGMNHSTQGTGKTTAASDSDNGGSFFLMYGTKTSTVGTTDKESSAEFGKQFSRYSLMRVKQIENNDYLYRPNRGNVTSAATFTQSTRKISDYYTSAHPYIFSNLDTSAKNYLSGNNAQFAFRNNIYTSNYTLGSSTADDNEVIAVQMTEVFENTVKTGDLQITKNVSGNAPANANYSFTLTLSDVFGVSGVSVDDYTGITYTKSNPAGSGTLGTEGTFSLQAGQSITITGIPYGTKYTVTETGDRAPTVRGEVTTPTALTSADRTVTVEVTNEYPTDVTVEKQDDNGNGLSGAELELYYRETTTPPTYSFNEPKVVPMKKIQNKIPSGNGITLPDPEIISETIEIKKTTIEYGSDTPPTASDSDWILPRNDSDYIYFRDYNDANGGFLGDKDKTSFGSSGKVAWRETKFEDPSTNNGVHGQNEEIGFKDEGEGKYPWVAAQFTKNNGQDFVEYAVWERFVDTYNGIQTVVWKIQPPDGYDEVRFCLYYGDKCVRTTKRFKFKLGKIYHKTNWGS